jgi:hypothetical protein
MTPQCPKQLPSDEYTRESRLPCVMKILGSLDFQTYLFGTSIKTGSQRNCWCQKDQGVQTPQYIHHIGLLTPWCTFMMSTVEGKKLVDSPVYSTLGNLDSLVAL